MILTDDSWYVVSNIRGVTGFVGPSTKPIPLTEKEVEDLGVEVKTVEVDYEVGRPVKIVHGPLEGFVGKVEELDVDKDHGQGDRFHVRQRHSGGVAAWPG